MAGMPGGIVVGGDGGGGGGPDTDDQTAVEVPFTPAGDVAATNVQTAIEELDNEKAATADLLAPDGTTLEQSGSTVRVKDLGITTAKIAAGAVTAAKVAADVATQAELDAAIAGLINSAPGALDTLDELAAAFGDDANFAATMTTALAGKQSLDATLTAFAALSIAANKLPYGSGSDAFSLTDFTAAARALLDDADASAMLTTLGVSTFIKTLLDDADAATARATLAAAGLTANTFSGAQTLNGGVAPAAGNPSRWPLGPVMSSGDRLPTTGAMHYIEVFIPINCTITGIAIQMGTVGGTSLWIPFILDSSGAVVANGNLAGVTAGLADSLVKYAFTAPYAAKGPAQYFIGFQANGTTARFKSVTADLAPNAGGATAGTFGTLTTITPPTIPGVNNMPSCATY